MAKTTLRGVSNKRLIGSICLGIMLASLTWLGMGYIGRVRTQNNLHEAERMQKELIRGKLTLRSLDRARYLLQALPTSRDRFQLTGFLYASAVVNPDNNAKVLPIMLELTHDPEPSTRANAADMAASCGKGLENVRQRLQQLAESDPDASVRNKAQKCMADFSAP